MKLRPFQLIVVASLFCAFGFSTDYKTSNIVLVTVDGVRWQELFTGVDRSLMDPERHRLLLKRYDRSDAIERREKLLPFFWKELAPKGVVLGNRDLGSRVDVTNPHRFSYPGYTEILLGEVLTEIDSNDSIYNRKETVLEFIDRTLDLTHGQVAAFASWGVFHHICVHQPNSLLVNAGRRRLNKEFMTPEMEILNDLQFDIVTPWDSIRHDGLTGDLAFRYLRAFQPRVLYIALDETDDWSHNGKYDRVIAALETYDRFLKKLWNELQSNSFYKNKTTLIIATDHGRGKTKSDWTDHGKDVEGAEEIWLAVFGPDTPSIGETSNTQTVFQKSIAATILKFLSIDYREYNHNAGEPIGLVFED